MSGQSLRTGPSATWDFAAARYLVGCAARKAPPDLAERLEEEWLADLASRQRAFSRILFGLGCCWATRVIARDFGAAAAVAGSSASGQRLLVSYGGPDFSWLSRRTTALLAIVCLHVAAFYAYMSGFGQKAVPTSPGWIDAVPVAAQPRIAHTPPRLPPPTFAHRFVPNLPTPDLPLRFPADPTVITIAHSSQPAGALPPAKPAKWVIGGPGAGFPDTEDYYPSSIRRLDETGAAVVSVCVDPRGRLTAAPTLAGSSGIGQLDEAALRLATAGSGHYRPTTENGQPVGSCYAFRIRFQLEDQ